MNENTPEPNKSPICVIAQDHEIGMTVAHIGHNSAQDRMLIAEDLIKEAGHKKIIVVDGGNGLQAVDYSKVDFDKIVSHIKPPSIPYEIRNPRLLPDMDDIVYGNISEKLQKLRRMNLTPEQLDYFQNSPPQRLEDESFDDYKIRREMNKLIIKYRGEF